MKKIILLLLLLIPLKIKGIDTSATSSILMDIDSNRILYEENINEKPKRKNYTTAIICLLLTIAILLATYSVLGIELTAVVGALLAVLWFFGFLLSRIKSRKKRRKVISVLIIIFLF